MTSCSKTTERHFCRSVKDTVWPGTRGLRRFMFAARMFGLGGPTPQGQTAGNCYSAARNRAREHATAKRLGSVAHVAHTGAQGVVGWESVTIVHDLEREAIFVAPNPNGHRGGLRVLHDVLQRLRATEIDSTLDLSRESLPPASNIDSQRC